MSFSRTLQKGLERFKKAKTAASGALLSGRDAFELYDTFGFPADLTQVWNSVCYLRLAAFYLQGWDALAVAGQVQKVA